MTRDQQIESPLSECGTPTPVEPGAQEWRRFAPFPIWKALLGLLAFDVLGFGRNFAKLHRRVSKWKVAPLKPLPHAVESVCNAMNYACVWYPKRVLCLQRSAVTTCLLRTCGVPAEMIMGAQTLPFKAHAWTEVNGRAINERRDVQNIYGAWDRC
jgi:hypothetical protein